MPCAPPSDIRTVNISSSILQVEWLSLSFACARGILKGYAVFYKEQRNTSQTYQRITVVPTYTELNITKLRKFTLYNISIAGYTRRGLGPLSIPIVVSTAEDGNEINTKIKEIKMITVLCNVLELQNSCQVFLCVSDCLVIVPSLIYCYSFQCPANHLWIWMHLM